MKSTLALRKMKTLIAETTDEVANRYGELNKKSSKEIFDKINGSPEVLACHEHLIETGLRVLIGRYPASLNKSVVQQEFATLKINKFYRIKKIVNGKIRHPRIPISSLTPNDYFNQPTEEPKRTSQENTSLATIMDVMRSEGKNDLPLLKYLEGNSAA